jgi:hypothetical protein
VKEYKPRSSMFLEALEEREDVMIRDRTLTEDQRLSGRMKTSRESGEFWMSYAARKSWAFDAIFWEQINTSPRFFKDNSGYEEGLKLLSKEERDGMEEFVRRKLRESETRTLYDWDIEEAKIQTGDWI